MVIKKKKKTFDLYKDGWYCLRDYFIFFYIIDRLLNYNFHVHCSVLEFFFLKM